MSREIGWVEFGQLCQTLLNKLEHDEALRFKGVKRIYGIPTGGCLVAQELSKLSHVPLTTNWEEADLVVDDIVDSGRTLARYPGKQTAVLHVKRNSPAMPDYFAEIVDDWVDYPYENNHKTAEDSVIRFLQYIEEDVSREGLKETPSRVVKSWEELFGGYKQDPEKVLSTGFEKGACDEMVILKDIEFYSTCEHHIQPFFGKVHIGYIPDGRVVGLSKLARLVDVFSRRLQIQERMTSQIADMLLSVLKPKGVIVVANAQHLCMLSRGVQKQNSVMVTSAVRGLFEEGPVKSEFLALLKG